MTKLDYEALRAQALGKGDDEAVTVNTRALIDKVLARYSGEWTTLRELLQNAADASARKVTIRIETLPSRSVPAPQSVEPSNVLQHTILHHTVKTITVENDGEVFKATDWGRLKKIAEGNPDETKIGAFGVGFYSVFSESEEPFVSSGQEALAFYWKGDALYTRRLQLPNAQSTNTTFVLPMRNQSSPVPNLLSLCQFLTNSLTFVGLQGVELWMDDWKILGLSKKTAPGEDFRLPKELDRKTRDGLMQVASVTKEPSQLDATWLKAVEWNPKYAVEDANSEGVGQNSRQAPPSQSLRSFFSRLAPNSSKNEAAERLAREERANQSKIAENLLQESKASLFIHVNRALIRTATSTSFAAELERATKKPPPKTTTVSLLSASYEEAAASSLGPSAQEQGAKLFEYFVPINGKGRIFIGFTTNQTTGLNVHISTPSVIPTVEREAIDLNNRYIRQWNVEILRAAGIVARLSWGQEMDGLAQKLSSTVKLSGKTKASVEHIDKVLPDALYLHNSYSWSETTPSSEVGTLVEEAFWTCNQKVAIATLSTRGVLPSSHVRKEPEEGLNFLQDIPLIPPPLIKTRLVQRLIEYGVITDVNVADIKRELEGKALNGEQLRHFLSWLAQKLRINEFDKAIVKSLLDVAVANDFDGPDPKILVLAEAKSFLNASRIPAEMPVPPSTLPFSFTKKIPKQDLELLGFEDLQMVPWLRWIVENPCGRGQLSAEYDVTRNETFAGGVLLAVSKQWDGLSSSSKTTVTDLLSQRTVVPTKLGLRKPSSAYFPNVKLFDDLPIVTCMPPVKEKFLAALGARKTIDIGIVFERLMDNSPSPKSKIPASAPKWSHVDLVKYLTSVRADIPSGDLARLKATKMCPADTEDSERAGERFLISELFAPDPPLRRLGLRTIQWPSIYRPESPEGRFLTLLGLRSAPTYPELVEIMSKSAATQDWKSRDLAMTYLIDNHQSKGYAHFDASSLTIPFLPIQGSEKKIAAPSQVFVNERAGVLGFDILRRTLQVHALKFGVKHDPSIADCVDRLIKNPPVSPRMAREIFSYMASRPGDLSNQDKDRLGAAPIIPVAARKSELITTNDEKSSSFIRKPPRMCFLGSGEQYAEIFDFVDFGHEANLFLLACGSKHEPSTIELARRLVDEPAAILSALGDTRYLDLLRNMAAAWRILEKDKALVRDLKAAKCLLAYREIASKYSDTEQDDDEDEAEPVVRMPQLTSAKNTVIVDDLNVFDNFKEVLLAAPMDEHLELFYLSLGAARVSSLLQERHRLGPLTRDQSAATKLQRLLLERTRLFLSDYTPDLIKHDYSWVQKNLTVECMQSISVRWELSGYSLVRNGTRSAVMSSDKPVLYITAGGHNLLEVSKALVPVLLRRAKPQQIFMLEMFLESSLGKIRSRGYNVNRILRAKAAEERIAEEIQKQHLAEEQERLRQQEAEWKARQAAVAAEKQHEPPMPGDFPDSPSRSVQRDEQATVPDSDDALQSRRRGLFSGISKHFNFDTVRRGLTQNQTNPPRRDGINGDDSEFDAPPPYTPEGGQHQRRQQQQVSKVPQPEAVTAPHHLQRNLMNAVHSSRGYNSNQVASQESVTNVKETATYCDSSSAQNIKFIGSTAGIRIYLSNDVIATDPSATEKFVSANTAALNQFASILQECADAYTLRREAVHIFYDASGSTIAFNLSKSLFFNYRYFENLHLPSVQQGKKADAIVYWSVVMAHEMAHNLVAAHSSDHTYYAESLVIQYFGNIARKTAQSGNAGANGAITAAPPLRQISDGGRLQDPLQPEKRG